MLEIKPKEVKLIAMKGLTKGQVEDLRGLPKEDIAVLDKYAIWHFEIKDKALCGGCDVCGGDCYGCSSESPELKKW